MTEVSRETPGPAPDLPAWLVGRSSLLEEYAQLLAGPGVDRGLIGPREAPRLWTRHLLNCAVVVDPEEGLVPLGARVTDVGSGAGLPGLVWAIARPDLSIALVEPLLRRSVFLQEAVEALGLTDRVSVIRGRAEHAGDDLARADVVTARAVAPLERLLPWAVPLVRPGGAVVALKGSSAAEELERVRESLPSWGISSAEVRLVGVGVVDPPTTVVVAVRGTAD